MGTLREDLARWAGEVVETPISWVFLTDDAAYKVKKPVRLPFLDFTQVADRRKFCELEVKLNRRLAPDVYHGVVPVVVGADGNHHVEKDGSVVDWAVKMRRLPMTNRADERLRRGALSAGMLDTLAARLAVFHAHCNSDARTAAMGEPTVLARHVRENFALLESNGPNASALVWEPWLEKRQLAFIDNHHSLFARRQKQGAVREGHGDLRLEHVYFDEVGEISVLDCLEFDEQYRFGDVCGDVAFLFMDLAVHGRVDLAEGFLAAYAREADDYALYALVDFYASYRSCVRAKIAHLAKDDTLARRHLAFAASAWNRPLRPPRLIAVGGMLAAGKSTVANRLGADDSVPVLSSDWTRKRLLRVAPTERLVAPGWRGAYSTEVTRQVESELLRRAAHVLESGRSVILDASFRARDFRERARSLARRHEVPFLFIECVASDDTCKRRLQERERFPNVSDARVDLYDSFRASFEPIDELVGDEYLRLSTERPLAETVEALRSRLGQR